MKYLSWNEQTITDFSDDSVAKMYEAGYVFTRKGKGVMNQTRSVRINLSKFGLSSENRRILKKIDSIKMDVEPLAIKDYDWKIGKFAKDFYATKFGPGVMSAQKVKELMTNPALSNFNTFFRFESAKNNIGWVIAYKNQVLLHYSYPFYNLALAPKDMGLGMMIRAIQYAKDAGLKYIYLGSLQRPGDVYKLQFSGLEWFGGKLWTTDVEAAKQALK